MPNLEDFPTKSRKLGKKKFTNLLLVSNIATRSLSLLPTFDGIRVASLNLYT